MKISLLTFLLAFFGLSALGQDENIWTTFLNKDSTLIGYIDKNGAVKIEPKFQSGFTIASRFENIMAVSEAVNQNWNLYYLTKTGRIVGRDSLHIFDNTPDCENEGFIRFRDKKTGKAGMFNRKGDIVIPAEYNELTRTRNGLIIALKGATKKIMEGGEHYSWLGGRELLIDTANNILIDNFTYEGNLNFYSLLISTQPNADSVRQNFKAIDGKYYSFADYDKEFNSWLQTSLLANLSKGNLLIATYKEVTFWKDSIGWISESKNSFINRNYSLLKTKLLQLNAKDCDYTVFDEGLNPYIFEPGKYKDYFNNCGESKDWKYPVKNIVINYNQDKSLIQDHFEFLRTKDGYKLISLTIRKGEIK